MCPFLPVGVGLLLLRSSEENPANPEDPSAISNLLSQGACIEFYETNPKLVALFGGRALVYLRSLERSHAQRLLTVPLHRW